VRCDFAPGNVALPDLPRFGVTLNLPDALEGMEYFGRGPHENYCDRNTSALVGRYRSTVSEQYFPYVSPQENGNKTDVRWACFRSDRGEGLLVMGAPLLSMSALRYTVEDLTQETRGSMHTVDLKPREFVTLNLDLKQRGVGGDDSWGATPHSEYCLLPTPYTFAFTLVPVNPGDEPASVRMRRSAMR